MSNPIYIDGVVYIRIFSSVHTYAQYVCINTNICTYVY